MSEQGTVTLLFTDLVGSGAMFARLGDESADALVEEIQSALRDVVAAHRGRVVKEVGDGLFAAFSSALDAVSCAIALQLCATRINESRDERDRLSLRVGLHAGEPIRRNDDYFGTPVYVGSRISDAAEPGQILASDVVRTLVGQREGFTFRPAATPDALTPMSLHQVVWREPAAEPQAAAPRERARHEATLLLFADIVDSTRLSGSVGDARFHELSMALQQRVRSIVSRHGGGAVEGRTLGDGVLAVFRSASDAIAAACECAASADGQELALHLGLHVGDVIREGENVYGIAVNIAARISDISAPNEVLVSAAVRDVARASAGVEFVERGDYVLKGIEEPQRLYAVRARDV